MGEHETGPHRLAVNEYRARATNAVLAANVRTRQTTIFTQRIDQGLAVLNVNSVNFAIDGQLEGEVCSWTSR
jgi:hypothetical protein